MPLSSCGKVQSAKVASYRLMDKMNTCDAPVNDIFIIQLERDREVATPDGV